MRFCRISFREGCHASNVIAVSLMTELEQTIAVTLHRRNKTRAMFLFSL